MGKRIRILFTIPNFKTAGSQYVLLSLIERIDKTIFEAYVCVEKFPESIPSTIPLDRQFVFDFQGNLGRDVLEFRKILKRHKIDIVHSWDYKSNYLEALATRISGVKYLYTKKNNAWSKRWKLKSLFSTHIAYDNPRMKDRFFASRILKNKISLIPHGVDMEIFKPLTSIKHDSFNLVCIGNIGSNKNQLFIIETLKDLPPNVVLYLYGKEDEDYRKQLDKYLAENNLGSRVFFKGYVKNTDIPEVLRDIDLFILPSINEGFPVSILEALACGVPVLSSDSGGGAKFMLETGGGFVFNLSDRNSLLELLNGLLQNPSEIKKLSIQARANIVANFSIQKEIKAYEELYKRI